MNLVSILLLVSLDTVTMAGPQQPCPRLVCLNTQDGLPPYPRSSATPEARVDIPHHIGGPLSGHATPVVDLLKPDPVVCGGPVDRNMLYDDISQLYHIAL
ncbi:hypothetical protein NHX12_021435 [Muraenolepis orangiensis]|uniref:Uncharacterized protein n=1 Tax=Muraenolepis orangiensis TaxID=630683 RepID=A0A9Q0ETN2_9TELE|nr:hypothetical protein NHX12_021435 [Muraenolepis orangiensis]